MNLYKHGRIFTLPVSNTLFKNSPEGKRSFGKPRKKWLGVDENDMKKMGVKGCRKVAKDRDAWKLILKEARVHQGP